MIYLGCFNSFCIILLTTDLPIWQTSSDSSLITYLNILEAVDGISLRYRPSFAPCDAMFVWWYLITNSCAWFLMKLKSVVNRIKCVSWFLQCVLVRTVLIFNAFFENFKAYLRKFASYLELNWSHFSVTIRLNFVKLEMSV